MKIKKLVAAIAISGMTYAGTATAASGEPSPEQKKGAASGLVIGALAGGPAGAFVGSVLGGEVFGKLFEYRRINRGLTSQVLALQTSLGESKEGYTDSIDALNRDLDKMLAIQSSTSKTRNLSIQFRTASSDIEVQYKDELKQVARVLRRNKDASVVLAGFADRRGKDHYNQQLSEQRVATIEQYLLGYGVDRQQLLSTAFGETQPLSATESLEDNFFDRRVTVELKLNIDPQLATR